MTQGRSPSDDEWNDLVRRFFESSDKSPESRRSHRENERSPQRDLSEYFADQNSLAVEPEQLRGQSEVQEPAELEEYPDELEEHFIPPEPRPLGTGNPLTVLAWIGAAGGPLLLVLFAIAWRSAPFISWFGAIAVGIAGIAYLWWSLPAERDDYGNGAQL